MKLPILTTISILFALNAFGGWHDTAPFIAWPATNHLRWVDNVGVYTNASNPTNPAYGAWTNNFVFADWYAGNTLSFGGDILFPYVLQSTNYSWVTNVVLNAKEVRAMDCFAALLERHRATGGDITNFWEVATPYTVVDGNFTYYLLWRDERLAIRAMKDLLRTYEVDGYYGWGLLAKFYYPSPANSPTNFLAYTETTLAVASGVPTNFFDYTPHRAADGSWTHYQRTLTNTFVLRQGTNAAHVATNSLVDSAGIEFTAIGTNGTTVTRYATNVNQQAGVDLGVYGWDGLRMVISNLVYTSPTVTWGIGYGTNGYERILTNTTVDPRLVPIQSAIPSLVVAGQPATDLDWQDAVDSYYGTTFPVFPYVALDWNASYRNQVGYTKTNVTPSCYVNMGFERQFYADLSHNVWLEWGDAQFVIEARGTNINLRSYGYTNYLSSTFTNNFYSAPAVAEKSTNTTIGGDALFFIKTNGVSYCFSTNTFLPESASITSSVYKVADQPALDYGVVALSYGGIYGGGQVGSSPSPQNNNFGGEIRYTYSNSVTPHLYDLVLAHTTNLAFPLVQDKKAFIKWDFEYK